MTRRKHLSVFLSLLIRCIFKRKNIVIIIRLQAIIMMNTLAHKEKEIYFQGVVTFAVNCDISTVYCASSLGDKVGRILLK